MGLRWDRYKFPASLVNAQLAESMQRAMARSDKETLSRNQKAELKQQVLAKLKQKYFPSMRMVDMVWNFDRREVYFWSHSSALRDRLFACFELSFGLELVANSPYAAGLKLLPGRQNQQAIQQAADRGVPWISLIASKPRDFSATNSCFGCGLPVTLPGASTKLVTTGVVEVSLESQLKLTDPLSARESISMRGDDPFGSAEADQALKSGKLPAKVFLRLKQGETEWLATLDWAHARAVGDQAAGIANEAADDPLFERMRLLEQLDELVHELYRQFLAVRLSSSWQSELLPALRQWVAGKVTLDQAAWVRIHQWCEEPSQASSSGASPRHR